MAVELTAVRTSFLGTGAAVTLGTAIYAKSADQIKVYQNGVLLSQGTDYTISGLADAGGVNISGTFLVGAIVAVEREMPLVQEVVTRNNSSILEEVIDDALDHEVLLTQQVDAKAERAIKFPKGEAGVALGTPAARASTVMGLDVLGAFVLRTSTALAQFIATPLAALLPSVVKGDPGGYAGAIGLFIAAAGLTIAVGTDRVETSGHTLKGIGAAHYVYDAAVDAAYVAANPLSSFRTVNLRGFRLNELLTTPEQFGAQQSSLINDQPAIQSAINYRVAMKGGAVLFDPVQYRVDTQLTWNGAPIHLQGSGSNVQPGTGTIFKVPAGLSGAVVPMNGPAGKGSNSSMSNIQIQGSGVVAVSDANALLGIGAGLLIRANHFRTHNVSVVGMEGNGAYIYSSWPFDDVTVNANNCLLDIQCFGNLKHGFASYGVNSNSCTIIKLDSSNNGGDGIFENGLIGNIYLNPHVAGNGGWPLHVGSVGRFNRVYGMYKETAAVSTNLVWFEAGGAGQNHVDFNYAEGSVGSPSTFTVTDGTATQDNIVVLQGVYQTLRVGGDAATGTFVFTTNKLLVRKGGNIQFQDEPLTANGFLEVVAGVMQIRHGSGNTWKLASAKPVVAGSRGGNAALASALTALAGIGFISDTTTA